MEIYFTGEDYNANYYILSGISEKEDVFHKRRKDASQDSNE